MRKWFALCLGLALLLIGVTAFADVVAVTGEATMETPYQQVTTVYVEYSENVVDPGADAYRVMDFALTDMKEDYESRPYDEGVITAVYTNDKAERREDKTSAEGKFVVIELAGTDGSYYDEAEGIWKPKNITGIGTTRFAGQKKQNARTDWSLFTVMQLKDVANMNGDVVAKKGILPTMPEGPVYTPEVAAAFEQKFLPAANGTHDILYNIHLPEDYDASKTYPMIIVENGGGGGMTTDQLLADGSYACLGADLTLDSVAISFVRAQKDLIVVAYQRWDTCPDEWAVDNVADVIQLNEYLRAAYAPSKVFCLGSSAGTMNLSEAIQQRPELFDGYVQCNGSFMYPDEAGEWQRFTLYKPELMFSYSGYVKEQIWDIALNDDNRLSDEEIRATGKCLEPVIANRMPMYLFDGVNTQSGSVLNTPSVYLYLKMRYEEERLSEDEINELVKIYIGDDSEYHTYGICEYHASSKLAVQSAYDVIDWILSR